MLRFAVLDHFRFTFKPDILNKDCYKIIQIFVLSTQPLDDVPIAAFLNQRVVAGFKRVILTFFLP